MKNENSRLSRVLRYMEQESLGQILISAPASVYWLTGYLPSPGERLCVLSLDSERGLRLFSNSLFAPQVPEGLPAAYHADEDDPLRDLAAWVKPGKLGIDKFWYAKFLLGLMAKRPDVTVCPGSSPVDEARMRKDALEIAALREASKKNDLVMETAYTLLREGRTEKEVIADIAARYEALGAGQGHGLIAAFGANGADPHHDCDDTPLRIGDSVVLDLFMPMPHYWCDMTRTVFFGKASEAQRRVYELVREANEAGEAAVKPGEPLCRSDLAARKIIEDAGYGPNFFHRTGHGVGLECHEPPDNGPKELRIAEPGMVFSVEPGIYLAGDFGVRIEDLVLVTESGCEVLNVFPKTLTVI